MISQIYRGEYPLPVKAKKTIYSEYWLPSTELLHDPSLRVTVELRVYEELARHYRQIEIRDLPDFNPNLIRGRWFSYDWDTRTFSGSPPDALAPEEYMRG
jgi:hypothetical protein